MTSDICVLRPSFRLHVLDPLSQSSELCDKDFIIILIKPRRKWEPEMLCNLPRDTQLPGGEPRSRWVKPMLHDTTLSNDIAE